MTLAAIEALGVVGAGGAGFPAHVKLDSRPDTILVNAAECEPLLHKDMEILRHHPGEVLRGLAAAMEVTGAGRGIIGIKGKHEQEIALLRPLLPSCVSVARLEDVYPAGDEITLIQMATGRLVQPGALPVTVGCVVQNVETLYNIGAGSPVVVKVESPMVATMGFFLPSRRYA